MLAFNMRRFRESESGALRPKRAAEPSQHEALASVSQHPKASNHPQHLFIKLISSVLPDNSEKAGLVWSSERSFSHSAHFLHAFVFRGSILWWRGDDNVTEEGK